LLGVAACTFGFVELNRNRRSGAQNGAKLANSIIPRKAKRTDEFFKML